MVFALGGASLATSAVVVFSVLMSSLVTSVVVVVLSALMSSSSVCSTTTSLSLGSAKVATSKVSSSSDVVDLVKKMMIREDKT